MHGAAIYLPVLHLPANLVTRDGVKRQKQSPCKQHLFLDYFATLVMTKAKMTTRHKVSRDDNLYYVRDDIPKLAASFLPAVFASGLSLANRVREKQSTCIFQKIF